ncbi:MAG: hypothetical protein ASARMPRED_002339 [Alectoria sarmentosa]|nr:MAG: hypothetical protein ASARMPRED_002339 [Alectoria sarmentosa]
MAYHFDGKGIFSTRNGEYARREKIPSMRIIVRSNPIEDRQTLVAKLQKDFPEVCKTITTPVTDTDVYEYFDYCDAAVQGFEFLRAVLEYIAGLNASVNVKKAMMVQDYVGRWKNTNREAFTYVRSYHAVTDLFTEQDIEEHGVEFLTEAMMQIKRLRRQEDDDGMIMFLVNEAHTLMINFPEACQSALRLQMQHAQARSNPEHGQPQPQGGLLRQLPGPSGQFLAPQGHFPLQRLTPSTEVLEHVHPGSTSRGDFHSDPTAHNTMDTYNSGPPSNFVAIPSRGLPGPFSYRPLPPLNQPIPLLNRVGTFEGNPPKGKKNPKKKSSDDARMVSHAGNGPRQAFNDANPKRPFAPQIMRMPFYPRSPDTIPLVQEIGSSAGSVSYSGNYHQPSLPRAHHSGNGQEPFHLPPYHGQTPMQPTMEGRSRERAVSNPYSPPAYELPGPTPPISANVHHQTATAKRQSFEENAGFVSSQVRPHISQPLDPHAFGHHFPDRRMDSQDRQDPIPEVQRPALGPMSNAGQPQFSGTSGRSRANEIPGRPMQEGCTIWIGGLPDEFDKAAVLHLLRPCRGLLDVNGPRVSSSWVSSPSKYQTNRSYAFAEYVIPISSVARDTDLKNYSFENPVDAAEALERLPQTRFVSLPEGLFLSTNYPKPKLHPSPGHYQHGSGEIRKRPASNVSPTKSRMGEESNRAGKSKNEHNRKASKGSARGKKQSTSGPEEKVERPSERVIAVGVSQKGSGLHPEEEIAILDPHDKVGSMAYVSQSSTDGQEDLKSVNQDPAVVQPDVSVETHANQVSRITDDGAREIASAPSAKPQVQESHEAMSSGHTEGCAKIPKRKSKGSNKLPVPENKGSEPSAGRHTSGESKPTALAKPSANNAGQFSDNSGRLEDKGKQHGFENEASRMLAPTVPLEPTSTLPEDLETPDQSFLGCNPTEADGEQPKASVANVTEPSIAKDDEAKVSDTVPAPRESPVSAVPLEQTKEPISQVRRRDVSISTQGSADTAPSSLSSTAPPSSSQTECTNSITQGTLSPMVQAARSSSEVALFPVFFEPRETAVEQKSEIPTSLALSETRKGTQRVQEELQNPINDELGGFQLGTIKENPEQIPTMLLIQLSPFDYDRAILRSPARKRAPSVPPRSSSLAAPSLPIKTHQKKKKPRNFTPVKEAPSEDDGDDTRSPSKVTGLAVEGSKMDLSVQTMGSTKPKFPALIVDPAARTLSIDKSKDLPEPETPFLMDDGVRVAPPKINRPVAMEATNADRYYVQKNSYQAFHLGNVMQINATFNSLDSSDSTSTLSSETRTPAHPLAKRQTDLEITLREAGFRSLSGTSTFTIKVPELALLETLDEEGNPLEIRTIKDGPVLSWIDDQGKIGPGMSFDAWTKQHEIIEVVKKATAVKRLLAGSPPLSWTEIESLRQQLSRFVTHFVSDAREQQATKLKAQKILRAKALLDTSPQRGSSTSEMQKWSRNVALFIEQNNSEPSPAYAQSRKPTTNSPSTSSRCAPLRKQRQERRVPILINRPDPQPWPYKLGGVEDTCQVAHPELTNSVTSGQSTESEPSPSTFGRRTPSEERPTPSVALIPSAALDRVSKLKDLFVGMEKDHRRWSDDRHRVSTPSEEERMTISDPEIKPLGGEFDVRRVTEVKDGSPEPGIKKMENEARQKPHEEKLNGSKGKELGSEKGRQDQSFTAKSDEINDPPAPAEAKEQATGKSEDPTHQKQMSQPLGVSILSFDSNHTTSNDGSSEEAQHNRRRGEHSPVKRSGYNSVAGWGIDGKRGGRKEGSKDPWALPQGEKPWGCGGEGRGEKKKRERQ